MENKEDKKYEILTDEENTIKFDERVLHRIRALKDFGDVKEGNIGGFVQTEDNLSHDGNSWIYDNAKCMDDARVCDNAKMYNNSKMYDNSRMFDYSIMYDNSIMFDNSRMYNNSKMLDNSRMFDDTMMFDNSIMFDNSRMYDDTMMFGNSKMYNNAMMLDNSIMYDNSMMYNNSKMYDNSKMCDDSKMYDNAILKNNNILQGRIDKPFKKIFQYQCEKRFLTAILTEENEILYSIGCQIGITKEQFIDRIYNDCEIEGNGLIEYPHRQEYLDMIELVEIYFEKFV